MQARISIFKKWTHYNNNFCHDRIIVYCTLNQARANKLYFLQFSIRLDSLRFIYTCILRAFLVVRSTACNNISHETNISLPEVPCTYDFYWRHLYISITNPKQMHIMRMWDNSKNITLLNSYHILINIFFYLHWKSTSSLNRVLLEHLFNCQNNYDTCN